MSERPFLRLDDHLPLPPTVCSDLLIIGAVLGFLAFCAWIVWG